MIGRDFGGIDDAMMCVTQCDAKEIFDALCYVEQDHTSVNGLQRSLTAGDIDELAFIMSFMRELEDLGFEIVRIK